MNKKILVVVGVSIIATVNSMCWAGEADDSGILVLKQSAQQGDAKAQYTLGEKYYNEDGVPEDWAAAAKWIRLAADQGYVLAQRKLSDLYRIGEGVSQSDAEATKWMRKAAEQGDADSQFDLGENYYYGRGVEEDVDKAAKWYRKAAEQGHAVAREALEELGLEVSPAPADRKVAEKESAGIENAEQSNKSTVETEYGSGTGQEEMENDPFLAGFADTEPKRLFQLGVALLGAEEGERNPELAAKFFHLAANRGDANAQFSLGLMYAEGEGVSKDDAEAVKWYRKAAESGLPEAQFRLGKMFARGEGVAQDWAEVAKWFRMAAEQGHSEAQVGLMAIYSEGIGVPKDVAEAMKWAHLAAAGGNSEAQALLGMNYADGLGVTQDDEESVKWLSQAAAKGVPEAQTYLGVMYANGRGLEQDDAEAVRWYRKAAAQGAPDAQLRLGVMYNKGRGVSQDDAEAASWVQKAADSGLVDAQLLLGVMYAEGTGVQPNDTTARRWLRKAATQGDEKARTLLDELYGEKVDQQQVTSAQSAEVSRMAANSSQTGSLSAHMSTSVQPLPFTAHDFDRALDAYDTRGSIGLVPEAYEEGTSVVLSIPRLDLDGYGYMKSVMEAEEIFTSSEISALDMFVRNLPKDNKYTKMERFWIRWSAQGPQGAIFIFSPPGTPSPEPSASHQPRSRGADAKEGGEVGASKEQDQSMTALVSAQAEGGDKPQEPAKTSKPATLGQNARIEDLDLDLIWVDPGYFEMGSESGESSAKPVRTVQITKGYWIGKTEVTQGQYMQVMGGSNPSQFKGEDLPVESVSWNNAIKFCEELTKMEGGHLPEGTTCRLPTEAEWEYAARGGPDNSSHGFTYSGGNNLDRVAWFLGNSENKTHPVGTKAANILGVADMSGNVWEWCHNWSQGYGGMSSIDPSGPRAGSERMVRGGSWCNLASYCSVASRINWSPTRMFNNLGFRVVLASPVQ